MRWTYIVVGKAHANVLEVNQFEGSKRQWSELKHQKSREFKKIMVIREEDIPTFLNAEQCTKRRNHVFRAHKQTLNTA